MSVRKQLACAQNRRDEQPNIELAEKLSKRAQPKAVAELVSLLSTGTAAEQGDAVKVLYELASRRPQLLTAQLDHLIFALSSRNSRVVWGILTALNHLTETHAARVIEHLEKILRASMKPSVIGKDQTVAILCKLSLLGYDEVQRHLLARVRGAAVNQFPTYSEKAAEALTGNRAVELQKILRQRLPKMEHPAKIKRVQRLLKRLER